MPSLSYHASTTLHIQVSMNTSPHSTISKKDRTKNETKQKNVAALARSLAGSPLGAIAPCWSRSAGRAPYTLAPPAPKSSTQARERSTRARRANGGKGRSSGQMGRKGGGGFKHPKKRQTLLKPDTHAHVELTVGRVGQASK